MDSVTKFRQSTWFFNLPNISKLYFSGQICNMLYVMIPYLLNNEYYKSIHNDTCSCNY